MGVNIGIAILSTSVALAGLLLVFLGFVLSTYQAFPADTSPSVLDKYRKVGKQALGVFVVCVVTSILSITWLLTDNCLLYWLVISLFYAEMLGVLLVAIFSFTKLLGR
jgi:hypothetical protein